MMQTEMRSQRDAGIEKGIDALLVNKAHREAARAEYRHAMATVDNLFEIVKTLRRFAGTLSRAFLSRSVRQAKEKNPGAIIG